VIERINKKQNGQLDILVNDAWGGDPLVQFGVKFWQHDLENGLLLLRQAIHSHIITSWHVIPLIVKRKSGLIIELTDGIGERHRGSLFYDIAKSSVNRFALAQAEEYREFNIAAIAFSRLSSIRGDARLLQSERVLLA